MNTFFIVLFFITVAVFGSFLTSYTYRLPRRMSVAKGRSICPKCKAKIAWYDNVPLISYLLLRGSSRCCGKSISLRYPLIELFLGVTFVLIYVYFNKSCENIPGIQNTLCTYKELVGLAALPYFLQVFLILAAIFIIDLENQFIPDELVYLLYAIAFLALIISSGDKLYLHVFSGFLPALFLLILNIVTFGRGMGLGDVKLALPVGLILGWPLVLIWFFTSFVMGGLIGVILLLLKKVRFGKHIPFGPFLIAGFLITIFWGNYIFEFIKPF